MRNRSLAGDYVRRATIRMRAVEVLFDAGSWADVVRESQEVVELALKGLLRSVGVDAPRVVHDVSSVLESERSRLSPGLAADVGQLAAASRNLRRDRELAFYGAEDLVPSDFYSKADAEAAREAAAFVVNRARSHVPSRTRR
ncbi:MAG: HEPN domain-containing protein [Bryobacterales bacterium]|nr:HEPN domain-containing protein [Bryobacterales bacterium]